MKQIVLAVLSALPCLVGIGQNTLSLSDAVTGDGGKLFAHKPLQCGFTGFDEGYFLTTRAFDDTLLVVGDLTTGERFTLALAEANKRLQASDGPKLSGWPVLTFANDSTAVLHTGKGYYRFPLAGVASLALPMPEEATARKYHTATNTLAFTRSNNVWVKRGLAKEEQVTALPEGVSAGVSIARNEFGITEGLFWNDQASALAFYQKDERDIPDYFLNDYSKIPAEPKPIKYPLAGKQSEYASVGIYHLDNKQTVYLQIDGPQDQYLTNLVWNPQGTEVWLAVVNRDQNHTKLERFDGQTGKYIATVLEERSTTYTEPQHPPVFHPVKQDEFFWISEADGNKRIYHYTLTGKSKGVLSPADQEVLEILGIDAKGQHLYYTAATNRGMDRQVFRVSLSNRRIVTLTEGNATRSASVHPSGVIIDQYSTPSLPFRAVLRDANGKEIRELFSPPNALARHTLGKTELVTVTAADGSTPLNARLIKPHNFNASNEYPVLVYVYNGPHVQLINNSYLHGAPLWMHYLANRGHLVFTVDGRGSAYRGAAFERATFRKLGMVEVADQLAGVDYLKSLPFVDTARIAVHGWSYGGYMTLNLLLNRPDVFSAGVAGGAVTNWALYEVMYTERYMDTPETNPEGYEQTNVSLKAKNLEDPLLLIHGADDPVVLPQHFMQFSSALIQAGKSFEQLIYPAHEHNVFGQDRIHLMQQIIDFVEENHGQISVK